MLILDLGDWNAGIGKYTCNCIWAAMCFPDDLSLRQQYLNKKVIKWRGDMRDSVVGNACGAELGEDENPFVQAIIEIKAQEISLSRIDEGFRKYYLHAGGDQVNVNASSLDQIKGEIEKTSLYKGFTAGLVLFKILQLHRHYKDGGSIKKATHLIGKIYFGKNISQSITSIKSAWREFGKVSPFWAAAVFLFDEFKGKNGFGLIEWLESDIPNNLLRFLQYVEYFKYFGEHHHPNTTTKTTTLNPEQSWVLPDGFPDLETAELEVPELQRWELDAMSKYKSPIDNQ